MRTRIVGRVAAVLAVVAGMIMLLPGLASAQSIGAKADLAAAVHAKDPTHPRVRLTNISGHACQVATTAQGTVSITRLLQGGKTIQPTPGDSASDEDLGYLLRSQLKTLQPGQSVDLALQSYKLTSGAVLRATSWSKDGGSFTTEYAIARTGALQMDLNYSLPITPATGAPACGAVFASASGTDMWRTWLVGGGIVLAVVVVLALLLWLWRTKQHHHKAVTAAVIVLAGLGLWWHHAPVALADVVVPPELQSTYDGCISTFNANRDITGPILDILNNPANHFEIVHTYGVGSDMTGMRNPSGTGGIFRIYWNPDDHHQYAGTGGSPDPCTVLYHELYHALDQLRGTFSRDDCAGSGIETKEVMATRAQNQLRARLGLPQRSHYGDLPLPPGDCSAPPAPAACTGEHCAGTNGDPHLLTFDGLRYDFQAAGEFIAAQNQSGSFAIQVRQQPWVDSRYVSINTALAFMIDHDRVEFRAGPTMSLLVNGKPHALATAKLPGGGQLNLNDDIATLTWADGSVAYIRPVGTYGLALSVQAGDDLVGKLDGLLGDANGNANNDLHARGSTKTIQPTYDQLYPSFADSWRISSKASLFTYDKGKDTGTYTNRSFPAKLPTPKSLPGYAAAEAFCKSLGISDPAILANCTLDMAITGRPEFARAAAHSQEFAAGSNFAGTTWQVNIKNPGDSARVTFDAKAGDKIFVQIPKTTLPSQCGGLRLTGPDGSEIASGCIINGSGDIDGTILPATGTYTISLAPDGPTGQATLRLLRIADKHGTITPDGGSVTAAIDQPGVVARYTFNAQAGQRVYLAVPSSTLDSECGVIKIVAADGSVVAAGCIINHSGYVDTAILPSTGQYTVVVDPDGTNIGQATLRLVFPTATTKPISIDGTSQTVTFQKPGSVATFLFNARAGQAIFVDVPSSQLPSQCGLLVLHGPDGASLGSGCVINHSGNLSDTAVVLPADGQYALTLDPGDGDTGSTTVRIRSH